MRYRKVIDESVSESADGVTVAGSINAVVAVNVNEPGRHSQVSRRQRVRIVQRNGTTEVFESHVEMEGEDDGKEA